MPPNVWYFFDDDIGSYNPGSASIMKPTRAGMAHQLIAAYGFLDKLNFYRPTHPLDVMDMAHFHTDDYLLHVQHAAKPLEQTLFGPIVGVRQPSGVLASGTDGSNASTNSGGQESAYAVGTGGNSSSSSGGGSNDTSSSSSSSSSSGNKRAEDASADGSGATEHAPSAAAPEGAAPPRFNIGTQRPSQVAPFSGMWEYIQTYTTGSVGGARCINEGRADIVLHWGGGHAHARPDTASGGCLVNDSVLAILELLQRHHRILYVDIGVYHADAVEEAFYTTDRVMTLSFHKHGEHNCNGKENADRCCAAYFPGSGAIDDSGHDDGYGYALNVPLHEGVSDDDLRFVFRPIVRAAMERYQPEAIVVGAGTSAVSGDRHGCWNLSAAGHGECLEYLKAFGRPMLVLGGPGSSLRTTGRVWARSTAVCLGIAHLLDDELPDSDALNGQRGWYAPDYRLNFPISNMESLNSRRYLERTLNTVLRQVQELKPPTFSVAGSVQYPSDRKLLVLARERDMEPQVANKRKRSGDDDEDVRDNQKSTSADTCSTQGRGAGDQAEAKSSFDGDTAKGSNSGGEVVTVTPQDTTEKGDPADAHTGAQ